jgi:flagellar biosynthesis protein FlhB
VAESKPYEPTSTWIARAKREGNVARSSELSGACGFLLGAVAIAVLVPVFAETDAAWIARALQRTVRFTWKRSRRSGKSSRQYFSSRRRAA